MTKCDLANFVKTSIYYYSVLCVCVCLLFLSLLCLLSNFLNRNEILNIQNLPSTFHLLYFQAVTFYLYLYKNIFKIYGYIHNCIYNLQFMINSQNARYRHVFGFRCSHHRKNSISLGSFLLPLLERKCEFSSRQREALREK